MNSVERLHHLTGTERDCVTRYVSILVEHLGDEVRAIWLFGSAARGDMWSEWMPMNSDIDLLVLTRQPVSGEVADELINETYPLFLECGRQIAPQFRTMTDFHRPEGEQRAEFYRQVREHGVTIYERFWTIERCHHSWA
jgi:predicted nucleotidyltransferase